MVPDQLVQYLASLLLNDLRDQDLIKEADKHRTYNDDEMYQYYGYLVEEELHPCLFPVDLENPEELPDDISIHIDTEE